MINRMMQATAGMVLGLSGLALLGCSPNPSDADAAMAAQTKIGFDLNQLDENGLIGPPDGKRSVDYEFCIPREENYEAAVLAIDASLVFYPNSPGRIGCMGDRQLVIGNTQQPNARDVLVELANQDFIEKIEAVDWE